MKTIIRRNQNNEYELIIDAGLGNQQVYPLVDRPKNEPDTLILPENPSNRKYFNSKKVDAAGGEIELTYKESKTYGPRGPKKSLEEYMTEEELELKNRYEKMIEEVTQRRKTDLENQKKAMTPEEKLIAKIEKLKAQLAALEV